MGFFQYYHIFYYFEDAGELYHGYVTDVLANKNPHERILDFFSPDNGIINIYSLVPAHEKFSKKLRKKTSKEMDKFLTPRIKRLEKINNARRKSVCPI